MTRDAYRRGGFIKSVVRRQGQQPRTWTQTEMEEIIRQERAVRQQAQLAAEQTLQAAKEAQKMILQLEDELDSKDKQLQQERAARQKAELHVAAQIAAKAVAEDTHEKATALISKRRKGEHPQPKSNAVISKSEGEAPYAAKPPHAKRARENTEKQSPKRLKVEEKTSQNKTCQKKMSLAEVRKAARDEVEKRAQERAKALEAMKK
ncbi:hypothetical protein GN958_ATG07345, partial [Phytophthora infestans]